MLHQRLYLQALQLMLPVLVYDYFCWLALYVLIMFSRSCRVKEDHAHASCSSLSSLPSLLMAFCTNAATPPPMEHAKLLRSALAQIIGVHLFIICSSKFAKTFFFEGLNVLLHAQARRWVHFMHTLVVALCRSHCSLHSSQLHKAALRSKYYPHLSFKKFGLSWTAMQVTAWIMEQCLRFVLFSASLYCICALIPSIQLQSWNEQEFVACLAKWEATTDQPFTATESKELEAILEYVRTHQKLIPIKLPTGDTMRTRMMNMADSRILEIKEYIEVCVYCCVMAAFS
jgi:hypothetical protein